MADIVHRVGIRAPIAQVYDAVASVRGVAAWWTRDTEGDAVAGGEMTVTFRTVDGATKGAMRMQLARLDPAREVRWHCIAGPEEWLGTDVVFALRQEGEFTIVLFSHRNWREPVEFMAHCSTKWATFLMSLKALVETGQGRPAPDDVKIDDWN